ncbi:MAG: hypothetical protein R3B09_06175 [Nannocystaceae bacterium]
MRAVAAELLLLALYYVGAALIALAILDWIAFEYVREGLVDYPWCSLSRGYWGWDSYPGRRLLVALALVAMVSAAAAWALVRIRRYALPLLGLAGLSVAVMVAIPVYEFLTISTWSVPVVGDPTSGDLWLAAWYTPGQRADLATMSAWTLPFSLLAVVGAGIHHAARRGASTRRALMRAAALLVPILGACALTAIGWATPRSEDHVHWTWTELQGSARAVMIVGGVGVALAAAWTIRGASAPSLPRLASGLLLLAGALALHTSAAPLRRTDGDPSSSPRHRATRLDGLRSYRSLPPWSLPRASAPCLETEEFLPWTWMIRVDEVGVLRFGPDADMHPVTSERARKELREYPAYYRNRGVVLLVDAAIQVEVLVPILDLLADRRIGPVHVAGLVVERIPWNGVEILTWDACIFGFLRKEAITARSFDAGRTWGELLVDPEWVTRAEP